MQALLPSLSLGGQGQYDPNKGDVSMSFGGVYDKDENLFGALWDKEVRVRIMTKLSVYVSVYLYTCACMYMCMYIYDSKYPHRVSPVRP